MDKIENIDVAVKKGDITTEKADCIIVPQVDICASYGGVGCALDVAGMRPGLDLYDKIAKETPFKYGDMIMTESGKPGVKMAHVVTVCANKKEQPVAVIKSVFKALVSANNLNIQYVAVPELGTGIFGHLSRRKSAQLIFNAVYEFARYNTDTNIKRVSLVVFYGDINPALNVLKNKTYVNLPADMIKGFGAWLYEERKYGNIR